MKKLLLTLIFLLFSAESFSQSFRHTSFDDRANCEDEKGTWREYGDSCVDLCEAKLDRFMICASAITYGCQCGKGRCWDGNHCAAMKDYKKNYDEEYAKEQEKLKEARKAREAEYEENSQKILRSLMATSGAAPQQNGQNAPNNNIANFYKPEEVNSTLPPPQPPQQNSFVTKINNMVKVQTSNPNQEEQNYTPPTSPITQVPVVVENSQSAATSVNPTKEELSKLPFYQRQAAEQEAMKRNVDQGASANASVQSKENKESTKKSDDLGFPILPLPTN